MKNIVLYIKNPSNIYKLKKILLLYGFLFLSLFSYSQFTVSDDFRNQGGPDVVIGGPGGTDGVAYFTSGVIDPVGAGWLRLTNASGNQRGYAYIDRSFPSSLGLLIDFEYKMWRNTDATGGGDGLSFFLFDATTNPFAIGGYGGSLGYARNTASTPQAPNGVAGGYIGVGLDAYGNFSNPTEGRNGGPGEVPNAVTIRGATTSVAANSNIYLTHTALGDRSGGAADIRNRNEIDYNTLTITRPTDAQFYRRVQMEIIPTVTGQYRIIVRWKKNLSDVNFTQIIDYTSTQIPPSLLKLGFAASTGGANNNHEIRNLVITTPHNLRVAKRANKESLRTTSGGANQNQITYTIDVINDTDLAYTNAVFTDELVDINGVLIPTSMFTINSITHTGFSAINIAQVTGQNRISGTLSLAPQTSGVITVTGTLSDVPPSNILRNRVNVMPAGSDPDFDLGNNTAVVNTPVIADQVDLLLQKTTIGEECINFSLGNRHQLRVVNMGVDNAIYRRPGYNGRRIVVIKEVPAGYTYTDHTTYTTNANANATGNSRWYRFTQTIPNGHIGIDGVSFPNGGTRYYYVARFPTGDSNQTLNGNGTIYQPDYPIEYTLTPPTGTTSYRDVAKVEYRNGNAAIGGTLNNAEPSANRNNNISSVMIYATPVAPLVSSPITYFVGDTASQLTATALPGHTLRWYLNIGGVPASVAPTPFTTSAGTTRYYVSQTNGGCESLLVPIDVVVIQKEADLYTNINYSINGVANAATGEEGDAIVYQVTAGNHGPHDAQGARFNFTVPPGVVITDPSSISFTTSCVGVAQTVALTYNAQSRTFSSVLNLPDDCTITYTFNGVLNGYHGAIIAESAILRPRYTYDPDATSSVLGIPTIPHYECYNHDTGSGITGSITCNNITEKTFMVSPACTDEIMYFEDFDRGYWAVNSGRQPWLNKPSISIDVNGALQVDVNGEFIRGGTIGGATPYYAFAPGINDPTYPAVSSVVPLVARILNAYYAVVPPGYVQMGIPTTDPWHNGTWDPLNPDSYDWTPAWDQPNAIRDMSGAVNGNAFLIRGATSASQSIRPFYEFDLPESIEENRTYTLDLFSYVTYHDKDYMLMDVVDKVTGHIYLSAPLVYPHPTLPSGASPVGVSFGWIPLTASFSFSDTSCGDFTANEVKIVIRGSQDLALETGKGFGHTLIDNITFSKRTEGALCDIETPSVSCSDNCYLDIEGEGIQWYYHGNAPSDPVVHEFVQPGTNQGFILDLYKLDNSFNMEINGVMLHTEELEFQTSGTSGQNVRFKSDGAGWGASGVSQVYEINSSATIDLVNRLNNPTPAIRVVIDRWGNVTLFGKRNNTSALEELEVYDKTNGQVAFLSNIFWQTESTNPSANIIKVYQAVVGPTAMSAFGYGLDWKSCETCTIEKDGVFNDLNADGYAHRGETITYTFAVKNLGDIEISDIVITDPIFGFNITIHPVTHQVIPSNVTFMGDNNNNGILDRNETWTFVVDYPVTNEDIFVNKGVYNQAKVTGVGILPSSQLLIDVDSTDPTPYLNGDPGWDPARPFHTYVPLKGSGLLITNPMIRQRVKRN